MHIRMILALVTMLSSAPAFAVEPVEPDCPVHLDRPAVTEDEVTRVLRFFQRDYHAMMTQAVPTDKGRYHHAESRIVYWEGSKRRVINRAQINDIENIYTELTRRDLLPVMVKAMAEDNLLDHPDLRRAARAYAERQAARRDAERQSD